LPLSEQKTVGSMTDRQRRVLAAMLSSAETGPRIERDPCVTDGAAQLADRAERARLLARFPARDRGYDFGRGVVYVSDREPTFSNDPFLQRAAVSSALSLMSA